MKSIISASVASVLLAAAPAIAQTPPAAPPPAAMPGGQGHKGHNMGGGGHRMKPWANLSPAGQAVMRDMMRQGMDEGQRAPLRAARDRITTIVAADRLDVAALRSAMDDERRLMEAEHVRRQEAMVAALQKLSPADRKLFAQNAQAGRARMHQRMQLRPDV